MRLLLATALLLAAPVFAGTSLPDSPHVVTKGEGKASAAPDLAVIELSVEHRTPQPAAAKHAVDSAVNAVVVATERFDVAPEDVTASDLSVSEDVDTDDNGRRVSHGFLAHRTVEIKFRALARFNEFLDDALAAGSVEIGNIRFQSSHEQALRAQARQRAVTDARSRAVGLAEAFGATLGPVYSINSVRSYGANGYELDRFEVTGSRIERGRYIQPRVEYTENVDTVFELKR